MPTAPPGSSAARMPVTRPSTPALRMMLTALGDAYTMSPRGPTRSTPSPARRSVANGRPLRVSRSGPARSVCMRSRAASMKAVSMRLAVVSICSP